VRLVLVAILMAQSVTAPSKGVTWHSIDPFCGRLESTELKTFPLEKAKVKLYRAKAKHLPCCEGAEPLGNVKLEKGGNFNLRELPSGEYWIVLSWDQTQVSVPVWAVKRYTFACDQNSYNSIELKPSAGTFEITMHTTNDQTTVHAQTH
jgi:hypothetical protein